MERSNSDFQNTWYLLFGRSHFINQNTPKRHLGKIVERIGDPVEMVLNVYNHQFPNPQTNVIEALNNKLIITFDN